MKKIWAVRKDSEAVSPVIATILMVAITVVLAAVLYVMVLGFGGTSQTTPTATYSKTSTTNGYTVTVLSITRTDVSWDLVKVQVTDGTHFWEWEPVAADLDGGNAVSADLGTDTDGIAVSCNVTDIGGNGFVSGSDSFRVTSASWVTGVTYTAALIYTETSEKMGTGIAFSF